MYFLLYFAFKGILLFTSLAAVEERLPLRQLFLRINEGEIEMKNYTYVLKCSDKSLYTGWTNDIEKRLKSHNEGKGAKYTRGRTPVELVYLEEFDTKEAAMKREAAIKKMSRAEKLKLPGLKV